MLFNEDGKLKRNFRRNIGHDKERIIHALENACNAFLIFNLVTSFGISVFWKIVFLLWLMMKKFYCPNFAVWTPNKQFFFSKLVRFRILSPHSKLWWYVCNQMAKQWSVSKRLAQGHKGLTADRSSFCVLLFSAECIIFCH